MFSRIVMIVLLVTVASSARAGLMSGQSQLVGDPSAKLGAQQLLEWAQADGSGLPAITFLHAEGSDLAGIAPSTGPGAPGSGLVSELARFEFDLVIAGLLRLTNLALPPSPEMDGLLKPA